MKIPLQKLKLVRPIYILEIHFILCPMSNLQQQN